MLVKFWDNIKTMLGIYFEILRMEYECVVWKSYWGCFGKFGVVYLCFYEALCLNSLIVCFCVCIIYYDILLWKIWQFDARRSSLFSRSRIIDSKCFVQSAMALFSDLFARVICVFVVRFIYCIEYGRVSLVSLISFFSFFISWKTY